ASGDARSPAAGRRQAGVRPARDRAGRERRQLPRSRPVSPRRGGGQMTTAQDATLRDLDRCGCCAGVGPSTPSLVFNRPGLSAVTVEEADGAPRRATVDVGVKVQSIPGHDEKAQIFETVEKIEARAEWNALKLKLTEPKPLVMDSRGAWLAGTASNLKVGDA